MVPSTDPEAFEPLIVNVVKPITTVGFPEILPV